MSQFNLLYKASIDGFGAKDFHSACDGQGPTLTIMRSRNGCIFGAYIGGSFPLTSVFTIRFATMTFAKCFMFSLLNPFGVSVRLDQTSSKYPSLMADRLSGPVFGLGDLCIVNNSNTESCYAPLARSFTIPQKVRDDFKISRSDEFFTGSREFTLSEIEVFSVQFEKESKC